MKNILVLVEEVADQDFLIKKGIEMVNCWGAKLLIGHVLPPTKLVVDTEIISPNLERKEQFLQEKKNIEKWLEDLEDFDCNEKVVSIDGNSIDSLLKVIDVYKVDLVITQHGTRSWVKEKMLGSCWSTLFADCKVPVMVYPKLEEWAESKFKFSFKRNIVN